MLHLITDVGSLWGQTIDNAKEAITNLRDVSPSALIKFQFCKPGTNNPLPYEFFEELHNFEPSISASIWDDAGYSTLKSCKAEWVKLAWSSPRKMLLPCMNTFKKVIITNRLSEVANACPGRVNLWTYECNEQPQYPVTVHVDHRSMYESQNIDYPYDGFSCHARNPYAAIEAFCSGAEYVEIHANPLGITDWPDARFALGLSDIKQLTDWIKNNNESIRNNTR